ncbi:MAG: O-antigen ligase family protein [Lachnospiraceae bacterium]|nr:O-antigen ligase family protein [Lachnospiraceae bacterium]
MNMTKIKGKILYWKEWMADVPTVVFCISPFLTGLFYEFSSALIAMVLLIWLWRYWKKERRLSYFYSISFITVGIIFISYLLSVLWAVDRGMAPWGAVKFLPVPLFVVGLMQLPRKKRNRMLYLLPVLGIFMTILSCLLTFIPSCRDFIMVNGRMGGFFQYPNTYAMYLLAGLVVLTMHNRMEISGKKFCFQAIILIVGIFLSGSRTVWVLLVFMILFLCIYYRKKEVLLPIAAAFVGMMLIGIFAKTVNDQADGIGRFLTTSFQSSTLLGRFLYMKDAFAEILRHPFGLGYLGYYYKQGSFQTGVYSVRYVHNDILQIFLDVGWIPGVLLIVCLGKCIFSKYTVIMKKILLILFTLHILFDFDLQYMVMWFLLLLCLDVEEEQVRKIKYRNNKTGAAVTVMGLIILYFGIVMGVSAFSLTDIALTLYPWNTDMQIAALKKVSDPSDMDSIASELLLHNQYVSIAWSAKARAAYAKGNFAEVIEAKQRAIACNPYSIEEYIDYADMLRIGIQLYNQTGDTKSADICMKELRDIQKRLNEVKEKTSKLAWKIQDKPQLDMPEEYFGEK